MNPSCVNYGATDRMAPISTLVPDQTPPEDPGDLRVALSSVARLRNFLHRQILMNSVFLVRLGIYFFFPDKPEDPFTN